MTREDFILKQHAFLESSYCDRIVNHFTKKGPLSSVEEESFLQMREVLDTKVLEKIVGYLNKYKPFSGLENVETVGEVLRFAQQCCFIYGGSVMRELKLECQSLGLLDKISFSETKDPVVIKVELDKPFFTKKEVISPRDIIDLVVFVKGDQIEINLEKQNRVIPPSEGDLLIIPNLWTHEYTLKSNGVSHVMLYRIAIDPSRYEIVDF